MTLGEERIRTQFNPSANTNVEEFKQRTAELIDRCEDLRVAAPSGEENRLWSLAQTAYEEAAMWAVKAATI